MATKDKILQLANERNNPSVTISMNTHRVHPDTTKDSIQLKNLLAEAEKQVLDKYERSTIEPLLANIVNVGKQIVIGLWEGIKAMGSWIKDKVSGFLSGIVDGVKSVLGIHSPSKVFASIGIDAPVNE